MAPICELHSPDIRVTHYLPAGRFYPTSASSTPSLGENADSLGPSLYVRSLPFNLDHRIREPIRRFQLYLGCRWCPLFSIVSQWLGLDWPHKFDCQVWTSLDRRGIEVWKLSCYLGLGYCILRKVPDEVVGAILNICICYYADVWISFICLCVISGYPAHVSQESSHWCKWQFHLSKCVVVSDLYSGNAVRSPSRSPQSSGSPILAPGFIVCLSLDPDNTNTLTVRAIRYSYFSRGLG